MTWDDARKACYDRLINGWSSHPTVTIFTAGRPLPDLTKRTTPFVTIRTKRRGSRSVAIGSSPPKRCFGFVEIHIYSPESLGDISILGPLNTLEELFTAVTFNGIVFGESTSPSSPPAAIGWNDQVFFGSFYFDKL